MTHDIVLRFGNNVTVVKFEGPKTKIRKMLKDYPDSVVDTIYRYAHGECSIFALLLAHMLGKSEIICVYNEENYVHFCIQHNDRLLDSYGPTTLKELRKRYGEPHLKALIMPIDEFKKRVIAYESFKHIGPPEMKSGKLYVHIKSNKLYRIVTTAKLEKDGTDVVVYEREGHTWVRPIEEFILKFKEYRETPDD